MKGPAFSALCALGALAASGARPRFDVKVLFEGLTGATDRRNVCYVLRSGRRSHDHLHRPPRGTRGQ